MYVICAGFEAAREFLIDFPVTDGCLPSVIDLKQVARFKNFGAAFQSSEMVSSVILSYRLYQLV